MRSFPELQDDCRVPNGEDRDLGTIKYSAKQNPGGVSGLYVSESDFA